MLVLIVFFISGILIGLLLQKRKKIIKISDKVSRILIMVLLFILGYGIGNNKDLLHHFFSISVEALLIAISSILGGVILGKLLLEKQLNKRQSNK